MGGWIGLDWTGLHRVTMGLLWEVHSALSAPYSVLVDTQNPWDITTSPYPVRFVGLFHSLPVDGYLVEEPLMIPNLGSRY